MTFQVLFTHGESENLAGKEMPVSEGQYIMQIKQKDVLKIFFLWKITKMKICRIV